MNADLDVSGELDALRTALRDPASPIPLSEVARRADVKYRWLQHFLRGDIPEPGYAKVRRVQIAFKALHGRIRRPDGGADDRPSATA
jgi:hypothetical protein